MQNNVLRIYKKGTGIVNERFYSACTFFNVKASRSYIFQGSRIFRSVYDRFQWTHWSRDGLSVDGSLLKKSFVGLNPMDFHKLIRGDLTVKKNQMEILFVLGFVLGVVLPNLLWKTELEESGLPGLYLLTRVSRDMPANPEYFLYILKTRGAVYFLCMLCGLSVFGLPVSVVSSIWMGFLMGAVLTVSLLEFGVKGMFLAGVLFFPQYLLYVPTSLALYRRSFQSSLRYWKNQRLSLHERREYGTFCAWAAGILAVGIALESYLNPILLEIVIDKLDFFQGL